MNLSSLGQRITYYRQKAGLNQKELAASVDMSPNAISLYENDKREPRLLMLVAIAQTLNVTVDALLGLEPLEFATTKNDEFSFVRAIRKLNDLGRERTLEYISILADAPKYTTPEERQPAVVKLPPKKKTSKR